MERKANLLPCVRQVFLHIRDRHLYLKQSAPVPELTLSFTLNLIYHFPTPILQDKTLKNRKQSPLTQFWLLMVLFPKRAAKHLG